MRAVNIFFFQCKYSAECLSKLKGWYNMRTDKKDLKEMLEWIRKYQRCAGTLCSQEWLLVYTKSGEAEMRQYGITKSGVPSILYRILKRMYIIDYILVCQKRLQKKIENK